MKIYHVVELFGQFNYKKICKSFFRPEDAMEYIFTTYRINEHYLVDKASEDSYEFYDTSGERRNVFITTSILV